MIQRLCRMVLVVLLSLSSAALAHDSNVATLKFIHLSSGKWGFELNAPLYGLDRSMRQINADNKKDLVAGSKEYKELIVAYIKSGFDVTALQRVDKGGKITKKPIQLSLGKGRIKLGNHTTSMIFEVIGMPKNSDKVDFKLSYMSDDKAQQNVLRLIDGERKARHTLDKINDYSVSEVSFFKE
ncbi:hypothetical protein [Leucothrix arctica]|uniref:Uncharacterized protein n=1 Tax=Leucothrix arctica TaxID=1481894 RepID=A0A317CJJ3_9GAMM|nr:hypothetical protein [Leucothrix arctica]PWQ98744.1 hypothetical protein DKT75_02745 [Leucothrix arctica]